jgi:hypothetical protein
MTGRIHIYACVRSSDAELLESNLARSPEIASGEVGLTVLWNQTSAAGAYARAMETASAETLVFTHADVYFTEGWFNRLAWEVERLGRLDHDWAVASVSGVTPSGEWVGRIWDCSLAPLFARLYKNSGIYGKALAAPVQIASLDESAFIVRRAAGITFDSNIPDFHLYGTDLVLEAERRGKRSYGLDMPILHNAKPGLQLSPEFIQSYKYMARKWRDRLPIITPYGILTSNPFWLPLRRLRIRYKAIFKRSTYSTQRILDPRAKAVELGLDRLLAIPTNEAVLRNKN